ncbi:serine hydrolase domain-containing protein [Galbibacter mesophilus]|uniref:serine hydrolase domain-containing protein n=1 Tax=Galbibacter mesophilus TaxID=379069 RepID=UPI00191D7378|nr:serine hydrolase [Galbibacter mesophilus]MCM5663402.1 serine hydrolase [Galbibacter mesophilus]
MKTTFLKYIFPISILLVSCSGKQELPEMTFPTESWEEKSPKELGVDKSAMLDALDYLKSESGKDGLEEVMIIRNGYLIHSGDSVHKKHNIYSSTKSFTSTVFGLLAEENILSEETLAATIDSNLMELYPRVQLNHFASMTSGYSAVGDSRWNEPSKDWSITPYKIDTPLFEPGTAYAYWDEAQMMFGRLLTMKAEKSLKEIFDEKIASQIGFGEYEWWAEGNYNNIPINNGCTGISIDASQLARFGHLFLNEGNWNGKQLINRNWVKKATKNQVLANKIAETDRNNVDGRGCYGYNWWVNGKMPSGTYHMPDAPKSLYYASGFNNNMCFIIPEWNMVIIRRGEDGNPEKGKKEVYNEFFKRLSKAIQI